MTLDELDSMIIEAIKSNGKRTRIPEIVEYLSRTYNKNIVRAKIRRHADSLTRYKFLKKTLVKKQSRRTSVYAYEVNKDD